MSEGMAIKVDVTCTHCGYNLRGLSSPGRCPECGIAYELRDLLMPERAKRVRPWAVAWTLAPYCTMAAWIVVRGWTPYTAGLTSRHAWLSPVLGTGEHLDSLMFSCFAAPFAAAFGIAAAMMIRSGEAFRSNRSNRRLWVIFALATSVQLMNVAGFILGLPGGRD